MRASDKAELILHAAQRGWIARPPNLPRRLRPWLCDRGSLTRRLKARCAHFQVQPTSVGLARAQIDETRLLNIAPAQRAYVRDVRLLCDGQAVVFAHSVLPRPHLRGAWKSLTSLGNRPLGEALFSNPRIQREPLRFRKLTQRHPLFQHIARDHALTGHTLWARRSVFRLAGRPLLVTEVFLPAIVSL